VKQLAYAAVTPARDEAANLACLGASLATQTVAPQAWVVVDNGSRDETRDVVSRLAEQLAWVQLRSAPPADAAKPGAPIVRAFHIGVEALEPLPDVVVKLDADVTFEPRFFERLLEQFAERPSLGIAGGVCLERGADDAWHAVPVAPGHVRGAVRAYRASCLFELLPLEERMGWDTVDEVTAAILGWETATPDGLAFRHHRRLGERDGSATARWRAQGEGAHYVGYRFSYLLLRTLHHARRDPAAFAMALAYVRAALTRQERHPDPRVRAYIRSGQSLRRLALR
jgi:glycosyltransferase involved in cell wall biosynthesis